MSTECLMNPDFLIEFIEMYRSLPCLWKVKSSDYSNRQKKTEAYEKLLGLYQDTQPQPPPVYHYPEAYDVRQEEENTDDSLESAGECTNFSQVIITKKKMSAEIFMNPDFLKEFIEMYRSFPCLWKVKCADYSNRQKKAEAYEKLVKLCKTVCPSATVDLIKHKIANLRTVFKKELKKVESSRKSGASGDDVYIPRLWYFDLLKFTIDQEEHTQSISNYPETYDVRQEEENTDDSLESAGENTNIAQVCIRTPSQEVIEIQQHQQKQQPPPIPMPSQKKRKPVSDDLSRQLLSEAAAVLNQKEDEFDAFGVTVAAKLRKMDDKQRLLSEVLITDILFKGMMKKLTEESSISLFQMPHYACQPPSCSNSIDYNIQHAQAMTPPRQDYVSINHEYSCSPTRMRVNPSFCMSPLPNSHVIEPSQYKEEHL
ncbi:uncharacterized protein LOC120998601 isoform X2 [Bufo bufo]|uniref:uncharacterized protein LOC120998601 isoform X2 n=1 Tax=Bufo bufo TaxID=8384 RepID=UPI001ABE4AEC|nr:uncharacterized protein LOC120998601 isoform X2 [Bufo bufo]